MRASRSTRSNVGIPFLRKSILGSRAFALRVKDVDAHKPAKPATILVYGLEAMLLDTRRLILEQAGFKVEVVHDAETFEGLLSTNTYDLLIVCHTVLEPQQQKIAQMSIRPKRVLQMEGPLQPNTFLSQVRLLTD